MPLQRFAPEDALLGERIPTTLTSGRDGPLHAEASWGRRRGGKVRGVEPGLNRTRAQQQAGRGYQRAGPGGVERHAPARSCRAPPGERRVARSDGRCEVARPNGWCRSTASVGCFLQETACPRSWLLVLFTRNRMPEVVALRTQHSSAGSRRPLISGLLSEGNARLQLPQL
jgi:hypothetical protein